jgi:hypothetical protein
MLSYFSRGFWLTSPASLMDQETSKLPEQTLATYFKLKPLDLNLVPGLTQSFVAFRTYKEKIPVIPRVPSVSTEIFLRIMDTEIY